MSKKSYCVFLVNQNHQKASTMLKLKRLEKLLMNSEIKIKEIRKNIYEIENKKDLSA